MADDPYAIWNVLGTWISGIGSLAAVIMSLYLARRADRVHLQIAAGLRLILTMGSAAKPEFFVVTVTNASARQITISSIGWSSGWGNWGPFKKIHLYQTPSFDPLDTPLPSAIGYGQVARYRFPIGGTKDWLTDFAKVFSDLNHFQQWVHLKTLRLHIATTLGEDFSLHPERPFIERLRQTLKRT